MKARALFFGVGFVSVTFGAVFGVACSGGSSSKAGVGGDAGTPTGGGTAGTAGGMMHAICTQIGQLDQMHAMQLTNCPASTSAAECEGVLGAKPGCETSFQAVYNCALAQPASSWTCDASGTHVSGCDTQVADITACATAATSTGSTGGTSATATAGTTTGANTTGTTSGTTHPVCAQSAAYDQMIAAAHSCSANPTFQSECETLLGTYPCNTQFETLFTCVKAQPDSSWSCSIDSGYATLPDTACANELNALNTCAQ